MLRSGPKGRVSKHDGFKHDFFNSLLVTLELGVSSPTWTILHQRKRWCEKVHKRRSCESASNIEACRCVYREANSPLGSRIRE